MSKVNAWPVRFSRRLPAGGSSAERQRRPPGIGCGGWSKCLYPLCNNNVLLVKIEGPVWYTIYHHLPVKGGFLQTPLLINQPMGKGHLCCAKIVNRWGPATQLYFYIMYLATPSIKSKGRESLLHFVGSVASARHIQTHQTLSDEEDDVLLSDSCAIAISCSDRLWWMPLARFTCKAIWYVPILFEP